MKSLTKEQNELCDKITTRAINLGLYPSNHRITCLMDVENATKYFNMDLIEWLNSDNMDFVHDICGIANAINRIVYPADFSNDPLFLPRFSRKEV